MSWENISFFQGKKIQKLTKSNSDYVKNNVTKVGRLYSGFVLPRLNHFEKIRPKRLHMHYLERGVN